MICRERHRREQKLIYKGSGQYPMPAGALPAVAHKHKAPPIGLDEAENK